MSQTLCASGSVTQVNRSSTDNRMDSQPQSQGHHFSPRPYFSYPVAKRYTIFIIQQDVYFLVISGRTERLKWSTDTLANSLAEIIRVVPDSVAYVSIKKSGRTLSFVPSAVDNYRGETFEECRIAPGTLVEMEWQSKTGVVTRVWVLPTRSGPQVTTRASHDAELDVSGLGSTRSAQQKGVASQ